MWGHPLLERIRPYLDGRVIWAVGGVVRDALLGRQDGDDLDLVLEGDAIAWARDMAAAIGVEVVAHPRFGTAELILAPGVRIDVATSRRERYPHPGALPDVEPAPLAEDLARRDFTVNAMAMALSGPPAGEVVDLFGGRDDLAARRLRPLRPDGFHEDPSRLVRAARYVARLDLALADGDAAAARRVAGRLDPAVARVADELERLLRERTAGAALAELAGWRVAWVRPDARRRVAAIDSAADHPHAPVLVRWPLRAGAALDGAAVAASALPGGARRLAADVAGGEALVSSLAGLTRPSQRDLVLRAAPAATGVAAFALGAERVAEWWLRGRDMSVTVTGARLRALGVPAGPAIGRALARVRAALLDGEVASDDQQLRLALAEARREHA